MTANFFRAVSRFAGDEHALISSSFWTLVVRTAGMVASFVLGVQLARRLGPDGFGTYGIVIALAMVLSVIAQMGLPTVAMREISIAAAHQRWGPLRGFVGTFTRIVLLLSIAVALLWAGVSYAFPGLLGPQSANMIGALLVPLFALTVLANAELRALGKIVAGQSLEVLIRPALTCGLVLAVAWFAGRLTAPLAVGLNVAASAATLLIGLVGLRFVIPRAARSAAKVAPQAWLAPALALAGFDLLRQIDASYGILLLGVFSDEAQAGYLRVALSTVIIVATPLSIFNVVVAPSLARLHSSGDFQRLQRIIGFSAAAMFASLVAALVLIFAIGRPLLVAFFGPAYGPAWAPLFLLACAQAINAFFGVGWVLLSMSGGERTLTASYAISVPISIGAAIPLSIMGGAPGAAGAAVIGALIQNIIVWRGVRRRSSLESSAAWFLSRREPSTDQLS